MVYFVHPNTKQNIVTNPSDLGKIEELCIQILELKLNVEGLEKERASSFGKLRNIEVMRQETVEAMLS